MKDVSDKEQKNRTKVRGRGVKFPLLKKWWFWVIVVVAVAAIAFTDTPEDKPESEPVANTATEQPKETDKAEESEKPTQEPEIESDLDIITRKGHPTYYGEMKQAHLFWDDVEKGKIAFSDSSQDDYADDLILSLGEHSNDSDIRNIEIYFQNMQDATDITLDKAVSVVSEYLPYDILEEWYKFNESYSLIPETQSKEDKLYIASYSLKKEQHSAIYYGSVDIIIAINENGQASYATIGFGLPRSLIYAEKNGYTYAEWEHDFTKK